MWGLTQIPVIPHPPPPVKQTSNLKYPTECSSSSGQIGREYKECFEKAGDDDQIAATVDRAATTNVKITEDDGDWGDDELETNMLTAAARAAGH